MDKTDLGKFSHSLITNIKPNLIGFTAIKNQLRRNLQFNNVYVSLANENSTSSNMYQNSSKLFYNYPNCPIEGWTKRVISTLDASSSVGLALEFIHVETNTIVRDKEGLKRICDRNLLRYDLISLFDFRHVFCICHEPEDLERTYIECSFGKSGCCGWVHPECVGLGFQTKDEVLEMDPVICPICVTYLENMKEITDYCTPSTRYYFKYFIIYLIHKSIVIIIINKQIIKRCDH